MTVGELINLLSSFDPAMKVYRQDAEWGETDICTVETENVYWKNLDGANEDAAVIK